VSLPSPSLSFTWAEVFGPSEPRANEVFFSLDDWPTPAGFFVGRNGTGKSRTARLLSTHIPQSRYLGTDRLSGIMTFSNYGYTSIPNQAEHQGMPLDKSHRDQARQLAQAHGTAVEEIYQLREQPEVWLRVAAFIRRAFGRDVLLREVSGFLDPYVRVGDSVYSLLRDEGHGLREVVTLLTAAYRPDWSVLIVDEPELHVHPAIIRLWLGELEMECARTERTAFVVTHEPMLIRPTDVADLDAIWLFSPGQAPVNIGREILTPQRARVTATLQANPELVSQLVFSPRPVLVEGKHDVGALSVALARTQPREAVAQTDLVDCTGTGGVALWFEITRKLNLDVRAIADLDALFDDQVRRAMDATPAVVESYAKTVGVEPPKTGEALKDIQNRMGKASVPPDPAARADWLAALGGDGHASRRDDVLEIWRDAGLWLHPQGRLEQVLGIDTKGEAEARAAAEAPGLIDAVAAWAAYSLDPRGEVEDLLGVEVERIAHEIMEALRVDPDARFTAPTGTTADFDALLVDVTPLENGIHRLTVKAPAQFAGWWLEFDRGTPSSDLNLKAADGQSSASD